MVTSILIWFNVGTIFSFKIFIASFILLSWFTISLYLSELLVKLVSKPADENGNKADLDLLLISILEGT
ncbi:ORF1139 [White spot syndrome virus]|uniref:ORF1139 n=1 Tax=White spot syndrome virus TaxID=342409 RepID=A0A2D3I6N1_9VIRU|nr:ORF1139 [White spot syndrome virus]